MRARFAAGAPCYPWVLLSTDLSDPSAIPYFLWDEPMTVAEFRERLRSGTSAEQARFLGKLLREARDREVWMFTSPAEVARRWTEVEKHLGRSRSFWSYLFDEWRKAGLLGE